MTDDLSCFRLSVKCTRLGLINFEKGRSKAALLVIAALVVYTRLPGERYRRQLTSLFLCLFDVFGALI